jgi:hypothetical protein
MRDWRYARRLPPARAGASGAHEIENCELRMENEEW